MKTILYCFFFVSSIVLASGCEKSIEEKTENLNFINQPKSLDIDINSDLITDFRIDYKWLQTNDIPSSGKSLIGYIQPLNGNEILYKKDVGNLFLLKNDTVSFTPTSTMIWNKYQADLIAKNGLDSIWTILSTNLIGDLYLGFQLKTSNLNYIGWMKVDIHKNNGMISIINMKLTESESLIIEE
jgi:hypothetical protein